MGDPKILFIDDEPEWCGPYLEVLHQGFEVIVKHHAQAALDYVESHQDIEGIIIDVMMPTPINVSSTKTNNGLDTGVWVIEQLHGYIVAAKCPVVVVTNREKSSFNARLGEVGLSSELLQVKLKSEINAKLLAVMMRQMINSA